MIYEPREDSFLILKYIKDYAKGKILDVGTGSGILAEEASKYGEVLAVDIDDEVIEFVKKKGINVVKSDSLENVKGKFDLIIFNPPYLLEDENEDEESRKVTTGGKKGFELIERFFSEVKDYLEKDGKDLIVFSSLSGDVFDIIKENKFEFKVLEKEKLFFEELIVCLCWKNNL